MTESVLDLVAALADAEGRRVAATRLAARLGASAVLVLQRDAEVGVLLPAPGFPQTLPGGPGWRAFLAECGAGERVVGVVEHPARETRARAEGFPTPHGAFVLIGAPSLAPEVLAQVTAALPLLSALLAQEHETSLALARAELARTVAREARELATALDHARGELQHALAEQARLNDALKRGERQKDEFLGMLAHELRNPLAAISTSVSLARLRAEQGAPRGREVETIGRQVELLTRMVDDLLDVSRIAMGRVELQRARAPLAQALRRAVETAQQVLDAREVALVMELSPEPLVVDGDELRLTQTFTNLLHNAAKFTDRGGRVTLVERREGAEVVVTVRDTGIGIGPEVLPSIFDLFFQADRTLARSSGGLGIGLSVVKSVVSLHGGTVTARSEGPGLGAEFEVRLPLACARDEAPPARAPEAQAESRSIRVLVIDDNEDAAAMLGQLLEVWGHDVRLASTGERGIEVATEFQPELLLVDIGLPGINGYDVASRVRSLLPRSRIVALSGYGAADKRARAQQVGFDDYAVKPLEAGALERLLGETRAAR